MWWGGLTHTVKCLIYCTFKGTSHKQQCNNNSTKTKCQTFNPKDILNQFITSPNKQLIESFLCCNISKASEYEEPVTNTSRDVVLAFSSYVYMSRKKIQLNHPHPVHTDPSTFCVHQSQESAKPKLLSPIPQLTTSWIIILTTVRTGYCSMEMVMMTRGGGEAISMGKWVSVSTRTRFEEIWQIRLVLVRWHGWENTPARRWHSLISIVFGDPNPLEINATSQKDEFGTPPNSEDGSHSDNIYNSIGRY